VTSQQQAAWLRERRRAEFDEQLANSNLRIRKLTPADLERLEAARKRRLSKH
jgi:hypothetical protein